MGTMMGTMMGIGKLNIIARSNKGGSALHYAAERVHKEMTNALIKHDAKEDACNENGKFQIICMKNGKINTVP